MLPFVLPFAWWLGWAIVDEEASAGSNTLRVRGRFNFRSGSGAGADGPSVGEVVADLDFRFRFLGVAVSSCVALSNAPQALASSTVSAGVGGVRFRTRSGG